MSSQQSEKQNCPCTVQLDRHLGSKSIEVVVQLSSEYLQGWQLLLRRALYEGSAKQHTKHHLLLGWRGQFRKSIKTHFHGPFALGPWPPTTWQLHSFALVYEDACSHCKCVTDPIQNVPNSRHSLEEQPVHLATCTITLLIVATCAVGKTTTMASKTSKTTTAWWLPSNLKQIPFSMKCQINKARSCPTQTWIPLGKKEAAYNVAASLFCTEQTLFRTILD